MWLFTLSLLLTTSASFGSLNTHNAVETEMFAVPISPNLFNWTYQEFDQQYRFHASLVGKPELPSWLRYIYSARHHSGFIFGTPPRGTKSPIKIEVVGLNRQDYETRRLQLTLVVQPREKMAQHEVELKIDNLNVEDLLDEHRMARLKEIFKTKLWVESTDDLYATFLASAIDLGARLPLKPNEGEGLVIRLGSTQPFSDELKRVREEVRPLSRLPSCPRDYKRTTVERLFRDAGFTLDWCNFELYNTYYKPRSTLLQEYLTEVPNDSKYGRSTRLPSPRRDVPSKHSLPHRDYTGQIVMATLLPLAAMLVPLAALTAAACSRATIPDKVEQCRYDSNNSEQTLAVDNTSNKSNGVSPNNSLIRSYSPKSTTNLAASYNRPQPPPYTGSHTTLHHRKSGNTDVTPTDNGNTPEHRHLTIEESLQLLDEASIDYKPKSILKDPVLDYQDSMEDYVPIKPEITGYDLKNDLTGYAPMKPDLDDIVVPELSKYGLGGVASAVI